MKIFLTCFGSLSDQIVADAVAVDENTDVSALQHQLVESYPVLKETPFRIAVNHRFVPMDTILQHEDRVVLMPPFSGG